MSYSAEEIARVAHEANRVLQKIQNNPAVSVALPWDLASDEQRASVIDGVHGVQGGASPEESHQAWCDFKRSNGWVYGEVKDEEAKTHPCLVPYDELPVEDQRKDWLFAAIVEALSR